MIVLHDNWISLFPDAPTEKHTSIFQEIQDRYSEKHRHYHSLHHLRTMFESWEQIKNQLDAPREVALAIWFHDVIYAPRRKDNEAQSAEFAKEKLTELQVPEASIERICQMILASAQHMERGENESRDLQYFLDLDLIILGVDRAAYREYTQQVRKEYKWVPRPLYRKGRRKVLKAFLDSERLYRTAYFGEKYEEDARENLRWELRKINFST